MVPLRREGRRRQLKGLFQCPGRKIIRTFSCPGTHPIFSILLPPSLFPHLPSHSTSSSVPSFPLSTCFLLSSFIHLCIHASMHTCPLNSCLFKVWAKHADAWKEAHGGSVVSYVECGADINGSREALWMAKYCW